MRGKRWIAYVAGAAAVLGVFAAFYMKRQPIEPVSATAFRLNTVVSVTLYEPRDEKLLQDVMALCEKYEKIFSRTDHASELYQLNEGTLPMEDGAYVVSEECAQAIQKGLEYSRMSEGAFDISVAPVSSLWDFTSGSKRVPGEEELAAALPLVDYRGVTLEGQKLRFAKDGMMLDLGAIAKGYIADRMKEFLVEKGVKSAMIDLGGNVLCIGGREDGKPFRVGIQKPFADRNETVAIAEVRDKSVVSSGVYERYFEKDGQRFHHLLNPKTGYPYQNGLASVTIISDRSVDGDGLSTACFALGLEKGLELVEALDGIHGVFITEDGEMHFSEGFEEEIPLTW